MNDTTIECSFCRQIVTNQQVIQGNKAIICRKCILYCSSFFKEEEHIEKKKYDFLKEPPTPQEIKNIFR